MLSKTCNHNEYRLDNANMDYYCHLLQCNACSCTCRGKGSQQTNEHTSRCEMVLNCSRRHCRQHCDAIDCPQTCDAVTWEDNRCWCTKCLRGFCSSSNSYRSNFILSALSTASQGFATQISTVQQNDNSHTWCE